MSSKNVSKVVQASELAIRTAATDLMASGGLDALAAEGFVEESVIKIGDPSSRDGVIPMYCGELIGPGADIDLADDAGTMPTWQFHPVVKNPSSGKAEAQQNVIHSVIASSQLDMAFKRAMATKQSTGKTIWVGCEFLEQGKNSKGQPLNKFRVALKVI